MQIVMDVGKGTCGTPPDIYNCRSSIGVCLKFQEKEKKKLKRKQRIIRFFIGVGQGTSKPSLDGPVCQAQQSVGLRIREFENKVDVGLENGLDVPKLLVPLPCLQKQL